MSSILTPRSYIEQRQASLADTASATAGSKDASTVQADASAGFFGKDGPSFRDIFDAINPLNHIPIVSTIFQEATGHTPTVASQLAGGALFGPIGFVSSLANVIFQQQTGKDVGGSLYAALTGPSSASDTQLASNDQAETQTQIASAAPVEDVETQQLASIDPQQMSLNAQLAASSVGTTRSDSESGQNDDQKSKAVLALYGASASANRAYQKAQFLPYLKNASTTQVM